MIAEHDVDVDAPVASGSLKARLAARREQLQQERTFKLPVLGYEDMIVAEYRALGYESLRKIGKRSEKIRDTAEGELASAADTLINASVDLFELVDGEPISLGKRWSTSTIRELFDVDLPDDATARAALQAVMPGTQMMLHFQAYDEKLAEIVPEVDAQVGER